MGFWLLPTLMSTAMLPLNMDILLDTAMLLPMPQPTQLPLTNQLQFITPHQSTNQLQSTTQPHLTALLLLTMPQNTPLHTTNQPMLMYQQNTNTNTLLLMNTLE